MKVQYLSGRMQRSLLYLKQFIQLKSGNSCHLFVGVIVVAACEQRAI